MKDLISRKALIEALAKSHKYHASNSREESLLERDIRIVKEAPAVDAVEVVHGRWLSPKTPKGSTVILCSECRKTADWGYNYCPNCGARMDGE